MYIPEELIVELINENAKYPIKAHPGDLGYDLFSDSYNVINPKETKLISTGIRIAFPSKYGAKLFDRSSVATKSRVFVVAGVIDSGYRGEIKIAMYNSGHQMFHIAIGDKIAQMVLMEVINIPIIPGTVDINNTSRGIGGFGSTNQ